jgi:hypothetical protein
VENKGKHFKENEDTNYKRDGASIFEDVGRHPTWLTRLQSERKAEIAVGLASQN